MQHTEHIARVTLSTYVHVLDENRAKLANLIDRVTYRSCQFEIVKLV